MSTNILNLSLCLLSTRGESFNEHNQSGKRTTQKGKAFDLINEGDLSVTSRSLSKLIGVERTNATRILKDLEDEGKIAVAYTDKCSDTGRRVNYYRAVKNLRA